MTAALAVWLVLAACPALADAVRVATFHTDLSRKGPGLLLRDILSGRDAQVRAVVAVIGDARPDVILLTGMDQDFDHHALTALADALADAGAGYPHRLALPSNRGLATGLDLDGDGQTGGREDAQGYGRFVGDGAMAILSRHPIDRAGVRDFSGFLWRDLPGGRIDAPAPVAAVQRLSSSGHWEVPVNLPGGVLRLLAWQATPPLFGPGDRNARRNHDEAAFWLRLLDADLPFDPPQGSFVLLGQANADPFDGAGDKTALAALLGHPRLQDPMPRGRGGGQSPGQKGDPALDTAAYRNDPGPGPLRVDYVLPSRDLRVTGAAVLWPPPDDTLAPAVQAASRHRLVWVDVDLPAR